MRRYSLLVLAVLIGCDRSGTAHVTITNPQQFLRPASAIEIDPRVRVIRNDVRRSFTVDGMDVVQTIHIVGPVRIVPADASEPIRDG